MKLWAAHIAAAWAAPALEMTRQQRAPKLSARQPQCPVLQPWEGTTGRRGQLSRHYFISSASQSSAAALDNTSQTFSSLSYRDLFFQLFATDRSRMQRHNIPRQGAETVTPPRYALGHNILKHLILSDHQTPRHCDCKIITAAFPSGT